METVIPDEPTAPTKRTVPAAAATTGAPAGAATSMPRCWPAAYGSAATRYGVTTRPATGHVQPSAAAAGPADGPAQASRIRRRGGSARDTCDKLGGRSWPDQGNAPNLSQTSARGTL